MEHPLFHVSIYFVIKNSTRPIYFQLWNCIVDQRHKQNHKYRQIICFMHDALIQVLI